MIVATFNLENKKEYNKAEIIKRFIEDYKIDVLCVQELTKNLESKLKIKLPNYNFYGKYRMPISFLPYNESNKIITKLGYFNTKTYYLPHFPYLLPRIITKTILFYNNEKISIYNTHISYENDYIKEKQLNIIYELIKKDSNKKILTGDFNLKINNKVFINFINKLKEIGIKHIDQNDKTYKPSVTNKAIDHIFVSDCLILKTKKIIEDINISDHYPFIIELK